VIGLAANADAIQLPNRSVPVSVVPRDNSALNRARQRWILELDPPVYLFSFSGVHRL